MRWIVISDMQLHFVFSWSDGDIITGRKRVAMQPNTSSTVWPTIRVSSSKHLDLRMRMQCSLSISLIVFTLLACVPTMPSVD